MRLLPVAADPPAPGDLARRDSGEKKMRSFRSWLKPVLVVAGLTLALSGCVVYPGGYYGGGGPHWHDHYYWR
jgi:hypothetical protein